MSNGWEVYYVVLLSGALFVLFSFLLRLISLVLAPRKNQKKDVWTAPQHLGSRSTSIPNRLNTRFFLASNVAVALLGLAILLIPLTGSFQFIQENGDSGTVIKALVAIVSIAIFISFGLLYAARKGDLSWIKSFNERKRTGRGA